MEDNGRSRSPIMLQTGYHTYLQGVLQSRPISAPQQLQIRSEEEDVREKISDIDEKIAKYLARKQKCLVKLQAIVAKKQMLTGPLELHKPAT